MISKLVEFSLRFRGVVIALDTGAPADIPAWCSMTGNELLSQDLSIKTYWIRAKE